MSDFILFGDVADFRNGLNFDKSSHGRGCLLIGVSDFKDNFKPQYETVKEINPEGVAKEEDYLKKGDLIFVRSNGNKKLVGRSMYIDQNIKALYSGFCIRARLKSDNVDPLFLSYFAKSKYFRMSIAKADGTNINNLNQGILSAVKIPYIGLIEQRRIAHSLALIDEKIELNNKINSELEAMAKLIYDYWFIQFDFPNTNGKPYKSSGGKMIYNEELKREIPEGWEGTTLGAIEQKIITGKTPSKTKAEYFGGPIPFITIGDIRGNTYIAHTAETLTEEGAATQGNKYLPEDSICVTCIASPGLVGFITTQAQTNQQINSIVCKNEINKYYLYFAIKRYFSGAKAKSGNTFANMNKDDFSSIPILKPSTQILKNYHQDVSPIFQQIKVNSLESKQMINLRDWLLPMLMNGQVTVK
ncbi:restriction endonuclease subunit S [Alteromonas sp. KS69]|uniref:restriction endonuclease subunit S n=1 Tax=Alteromonas sp. KS69 TaxID=2109917 RepID=UPI000F882ECA|nr:restriction endonuclease subunit S [Alteromonas sp. KS69]RUP75760.1 restriction endonuclease subunit S [Alteromonas sp. KS69]